MGRKGFNWTFAIALVLGLLVLGLTAVTIRQSNRTRKAEEGLKSGTEAYEKGQWRAAAQGLGQYLSMNLDDIEVLKKYAHAQLHILPLKRENVQQAVGAYRNVLLHQPDDEEAAKNLIQIYMRQGLAGESINIANDFLLGNEDPGPEIPILLAMCYLQEENYEEARKQLESLLEDYPDHIDVYGLYARCVQQFPERFKDESSESERTSSGLYELAIANNPESPEAYILRADYLLALRPTRSGTKDEMKQKRAEAFQDIDKARALIGPEDTGAMIKMARLLIEAVKQSEADKLSEADLLAEAEKYLRQVEEQDPADRALWDVWAIWARTVDDEEQKKAVASRGLASLPGEAWNFMLSHAVDLYLQSGAMEQARECLDKLEEKEIAPGLMAYYRGIFALQENDPYEVITHMQKAVPALGASQIQLSKRLAARRILADAYLKVDNIRSAESQYKMMVDEFPFTYEANMHYARFLQQRGRYRQAMEYVRKALYQIGVENKEDRAEAAALEARLILADQAQNVQQHTDQLDTLIKTMSEGDKNELDVEILKIERLLLKKEIQQAKSLIDKLKDQYPDEIKLDLMELQILLSAGELEGQDLLEARLTAMTEKYPGSPLPVRYLVNLKAAEEAYEECVALIQGARQRIEGHWQQRELMFLLAEVYEAAGKPEKQWAVLEEIESIFPRDIRVKIVKLRHERLAGDPERAQAIIDRIKQIEGAEGWQWRIEQARLWMQEELFSSKYPTLVALLKENLQRDPGDQVSRLILAEAYEKRGELELAASLYRMVYNSDSDNIDLIVRLVSVLNQLGKTDDARQILDQAAFAEVEDPQLERLKFEGFIRQGDIRSGIDVLETMMAETRDEENVGLYLNLARLKMNIGRYAEAEAILEAQRAKHPDDPALIEAFIQLRYLQSQYEQALTWCDRLIEVRDDTASLCTRAEIHAYFDRHDKARADFAAAVAQSPDDPQAWLRKCDYHRSQNETEEAMAALEKAAELSPEDERIQFRQISLLQSTGTQADRQKAQKIIRQGLSANPDSYQFRLYKVEDLLRDGSRPSTEEAERILNDLRQEYPTRPAAWQILGEIALNANRPNEASQIAMKALAAVPNKNDRGLLLLKARSEAQQSMNLALLVYEKLHELYPNDIEIIIELANAYVETQDYQAAVDLIKRNEAYITPPYAETADLNLVRALYKQGKTAQAEALLTQLKKDYPESIRPCLAHADLLIEQRKWAAVKSITADLLNTERGPALAINLSRQLFARSDRSPEAIQLAEWLLHEAAAAHQDHLAVRMTLAEYQATHGKEKAAIELYRQILEINPDTLVALNNLSYLLAEHTTNYQEALQCARRGLELRPDYIDLIDTLGMIHFKMRNYREALTQFDKSIQLYHENDPALARSIGRRAEVWAAMNNRTKALEDINRALSLNRTYHSLAPERQQKLENLRNRLRENN